MPERAEEAAKGDLVAIPHKADDLSRRPPLRRGLRIVAFLAIAVLLALGAAWAGARYTTENHSVLAEEGPPAPTTALVEQRHIVDTRTISGEVVIETVPIAIPEVAPGQQAVATSPVLPVGHDVAERSVIAFVADRPVIVLEGSTPMYRTITPGDKGSDVAILQDALVDTGFLTATFVDGEYGTSTQRAVVAMYESVGAAAAENAAPSAPGAPATQSGQSGTIVPLGEVVFIDSLPATVVAAQAGPALEQGEPLVLVSAGDPEIHVPLSAAQAAAFAPLIGEQTEAVTMVAIVAGESVTVKLDSIVDAGSGGEPGSADLIAVFIPVQGTGLDPTPTATRVTIDVRLTDTPSLVVPASALWAHGDGTDRVTVLLDDGTTTDVVVIIEHDAGGWFAVSDPDGQLSEGDHVITSGRSSVESGD